MRSTNKPLLRRFYQREPVIVARELIGKLLIRETAEGVCSGRIVETEAYLAESDLACHASRGRTRKNATMFGKAGLLYVYSIHARYCMNVVTEREGIPSAVLIRAVEPVSGIELMQVRRGREALRDLTRGPARLCEAFAVTRQLDAFDLTKGDEIWISDSPVNGTEIIDIGVSPRIGVTSAHELELRFFVRGNSYVSGRKQM